VINDEEDKYIYLVMEYLSGGSILSKQQSSICLDEKVARSYFVDVACGLEYRTLTPQPLFCMQKALSTNLHLDLHPSLPSMTTNWDSFTLKFT
jgi:serine/threonine protein kinase